MYKPSNATLDFFIWRKLYLPEHSNVTPISHYKMIDYYFASEPDSIRMVECHRGIGKTQLSMEFSLYCVCEGIENYVLFVGATQDLTNDIVSSGAQMLEDAHIPGVSVKRAVEGVLEVNTVDGDTGYLVAKSTGSKLRGVAKGKKRYRPTLIVLDDLVSDDLIENPMRMRRANRWMTSALLPTLAPGGKTIGSGTPMHKSDPFMTLVDKFGSYKIPLSVDSFPDRFTEEYIARKKQQYVDLGQLRDWKREFELVLTDDETRIFDIYKIQTIRESEVPGDLTWFCTLDGAFSEKDSADYSSFSVLGLDDVGRWYVAPYAMKSNTADVVDKLFELQAMYGFNDVGIEKGSFRLAIQSDIDRRMIEYQQYFSVSELSTSGSKISRIKSLTPVINSGRLTIIDTGLDAELLMEQITMTDNNAVLSVHDDHIDSMCQLLQMNLYYNDDGEPTREDYVGVTAEFRSNY